MKVSELINILSEMPQDLSVYMRGGSMWFDPYRVESRSDNEDSVVIIMDKEAAS